MHYGKMNKDKTIILVYVFILIGIISGLLLIFFAPHLQNISSPISIHIYNIFSSICHQIDSRCFHIYGYPLAVCTRCLGIYFGFLSGTVYYPLLRGFKRVFLPDTKFFLLVSLPIALDMIGNTFLVWKTPGWVRFILGLIWGTILPFYLITGLTELLNFAKRNRKS